MIGEHRTHELWTPGGIPFVSDGASSERGTISETIRKHSVRKHSGYMKPITGEDLRHRVLVMLGDL